MYTSDRMVDLHAHTDCSDGTLSPSALIEEAVWKGLSAIAVTDHDSVSGIREASAKGYELSIEVISGVEISCEFNGLECHILGYCIDDLELISKILHPIIAKRRERMREMVDRINFLGMKLTYSEVEEQAPGEAIGRPHLARALVKKGYVKTIGQAFERYIGDGCSACVEKGRLAVQEAISTIHASGGLAVLAHPNINDVLLSLPSFLQDGIDGLEVYYPTHSPEFVSLLESLALQHHLVMTGGSDFHGPEVTARGLGYPVVPYSVLVNLRTAKERRSI